MQNRIMQDLWEERRDLAPQMGVKIEFTDDLPNGPYTQMNHSLTLYTRRSCTYKEVEVALIKVIDEQNERFQGRHRQEIEKIMYKGGDVSPNSICNEGEHTVNTVWITQKLKQKYVLMLALGFLLVPIILIIIPLANGTFKEQR